jgi:hypothetical protein
MYLGIMTARSGLNHLYCLKWKAYFNNEGKEATIPKQQVDLTGTCFYNRGKNQQNPNYSKKQIHTANSQKN